MEKFFKINIAPYYQINSVRVSNVFDKKYGGYIASVEFVERLEDNSHLFGKAFCAEYYQIGGDGAYPLIEAKRRSKRKEEESGNLIEERAREFAEKYLSQVSEKLGKKIEIVKE